MGTWVRGWFLLTLLLAGCASPGDQQTTAHRPAAEGVAPTGGGRIIDHLPGNVTVTIMDVSPGSSVLIQTPGTVALFDTGTDSVQSRQRVEDALSARGITSLDYLVLSHPGRDRTGGCSAVVQAFHVERVLQPGMNASSPAWRTCQKAIEKAGVPVLASLQAGQLLRAGDQLTIEILGVDATAQPPEDGGLAVRVLYGGFSLVLVGDRSCASQQYLLEAGVHPRADVLELPLHGSSEAACPAWLDATSPRYAFLSPDAGVSSHALDSDLAGRGIDLLRPGPGDITITSDGNGINVTA